MRGASSDACALCLIQIRGVLAGKDSGDKENVKRYPNRGCASAAGAMPLKGTLAAIPSEVRVNHYPTVLTLKPRPLKPGNSEHQTVSNASREGARVAARSTSNSVTTVEDSIMNYMWAAFPNVPSAVLSTAVTIDVRNSTGTLLTGSTLASVASGIPVQVDVSLQFDAIRYIPGLDALDNRTIEISTDMRRE